MLPAAVLAVSYLLPLPLLPRQLLRERADGLRLAPEDETAPGNGRGFPASAPRQLSRHRSRGMLPAAVLAVCYLQPFSRYVTCSRSRPCRDSCFVSEPTGCALPRRTKRPRFSRFRPSTVVSPARPPPPSYTQTHTPPPPLPAPPRLVKFWSSSLLVVPFVPTLPHPPAPARPRSAPPVPARPRSPPPRSPRPSQPVLAPHRTARPHSAPPTKKKSSN
jgi:hypothetical protein